MTSIIGASGLRHMYVMYILRSLKNGMFYIGSTKDLYKRLEQHNKGWSRYTKNRGPFEIVYKEMFKTLAEAKKREYYLKSLKSRKVIEKLIQGAIV